MVLDPWGLLDPKSTNHSYKHGSSTTWTSIQHQFEHSIKLPICHLGSDLAVFRLAGP